MLRILQEKLGEWHRKPKRKPIIIRGARQVGKSTLVRQFAAEARLKLCEVNLERFIQLDTVFQSMDTKQILNGLQTTPGASPISENTLLFLDEIQATPHALQALRYLQEDHPNLAIVAAGSLLEFVLRDHDFPMPVGRVEYLHLAPMHYEEFLHALGEERLALRLKGLPAEPAISLEEHKRLLDLLRQYFFVGGMPEAVKTYADNRSFRLVSDVHNSILDTYKDDFSKYSHKPDLLRLHRVMDYATRSVGERIKYSRISDQEQSRSIRRIIDLLCYAKITTRVLHSSAQKVPMSVDVNDKVFKLLFLDVGLMNRNNQLDPKILIHNPDLLKIDVGKIAEQFVGQELLVSSPVFFWARDKPGSNAEVDYVVSRAQHIIPVEVKSGKSGRLKSLMAFAESHPVTELVRFDTNLPSTQKVILGEKKKRTCDLRSWPLYAAGVI